MRFHDEHSPHAVSWAVFLGCTTPDRLGREMGVSTRRAAHLLGNALRRGMITRVRRGLYSCDKSCQ